MRLMGLSGERAAAALAAAFGIANVLFQAASASDRSAPEAVLAIAGALAPTLAILVAWWAPALPVTLAMLVVAMLLALPELVLAGSLLALLVEIMLVVAVASTPLEPSPRARKRRKLSIVF